MRKSTLKYSKRFAWRPIPYHVFSPSRLVLLWLRWYSAIYEKKDGKWVLLDVSIGQNEYKPSVLESWLNEKVDTR